MANGPAKDSNVAIHGQANSFKADLHHHLPSERYSHINSCSRSVPSVRGESFKPKISKLLATLLIIGALLAGAGLRVVQLGTVPLGLYCDEASNGYDAYSILKTGRDQHGNFLPLVIQGLNDERMPLFDYSLVPLIRIFGLQPSVVRLGAALWGMVDMVAITAFAGLTLGLPGAVISAILICASPWHLPLSRYGVESTLISASVTLAVAFFFLWLKRHEDRWIWLSSIFFGLTFYSNPITKVFTPFMLALLVLLYWPQLRRSGIKALAALSIILAIAAPLAVLSCLDFAEMQAHFSELSLFHYISTCPGCSHAAQVEAAHASLGVRAIDFGAAWLGYFSPGFLFLTGDKGGHWELLFPRGFGMLLPEQAPLIAFAMIGLFGRRKRLALTLVGWLALAALPAALLVPEGAWSPPSAAHLPTPHVLASRLGPNVPLTPALLFTHPEARHDVLAIAPWVLLSALGFVTLIEWTSRKRMLQTAAVTLVIFAVILNGARFVRWYFRDYPIVAAPYFYYGLSQVIATVERLQDAHHPVVIDRRIAQAYIQVLFREHYPPQLLQRGKLRYAKESYPLLLHPHSEPVSFEHYFFDNPQHLSAVLPQGIFVFAGDWGSPSPLSFLQEGTSWTFPLLSIRYPDGTLAYRVFYKTLLDVKAWKCLPRGDVSITPGNETMVCSVSAATPTKGGPWRAIVTFHAVVNDSASGVGWITCRFGDGSSNLLAHTWIPSNKYRYWNETLISSGSDDVYGDKVIKTWSWQCESRQSTTVIAAIEGRQVSNLQIDFVPASGPYEQAEGRNLGTVGISAHGGG